MAKQPQIGFSHVKLTSEIILFIWVKRFYSDE